MKVIRLTYRDSDVNPNVCLMLFLRFMGIYVYERFLGPKKVRPEEIRILAGDEQGPPVFTAYDSEIFIVGSERDLREYISLSGKEGACTSVIALNSNLPGLPTDAIFYTKGQEEALLVALINRFLAQGLILPDQADELKILAGIYCGNRVVKLTLRAKYFFTALDKAQVLRFAADYEAVLKALFAQLQKGICSWGDRYLIYTQYAALHTTYELDCFCLRYKLPMAYNREALLALCDTLEAGFSGLLGDSVKMLKGQIYDDLFSNSNKAYEYYVKCCNVNMAYNSYVYFRKGQYWQHFANDYSSALKYYLNAVSIYPEYYRAWFKIGFCYQKLEKYKEAIAAYDNVRKCLLERIAGRCVRPMEIEHIFKSQLLMACIFEENNNLNSAIEAAEVAESIWDMIESTSFYELMCGANIQEQKRYREKTKANLDINQIYEKLTQWYTILGEREEAADYRAKLAN